MTAKLNRGAQTESTQKRAAIYPRVSRSQQEEDGTSLQTQEEHCRRHAAERGYVVDEAHVYREVHTGVELWERPQLTRLREVIRQRAVDAVVVYAIDRLARDPVHLGVIVSEADHAGVEILFVSEPLDSSPEGQLIRFVRGYAAKVEHEKIRERSIRGRLARAQAGKLIPVGRPLFGYCYANGNTAYEIDPVTSPVVQRIFSLAAAGATIRSIASRFLAEGVPGPTAGAAVPWYLGTVHGILKNRRYTGRAGAWLTKRVKNTRTGHYTSVVRPESEQLILPEGTIPPLVDEATFAAVQARFQLNREHAVRNNREPEAYLLRGGYIRCGTCGRAVVTKRGAPTDMVRPKRDYRCCRSSDPGNRCRLSISAGVLDAAVWGHVSRVLTTPDLIAEELERTRNADPGAADVAAIERALTAVARQQRNLIENLANVNGATAALVTDKLNALEAQRQQLSDERQAVLARAESHKRAQGRLGDLREWCTTVAANLSTLTYQEKRLALDALGVRVRVWPKGHEPRYEITANVPLDAPLAFSTS